MEDAVRRALGTFDASAALGVRTWSPTAPAWSTARADVELLRPADASRRRPVRAPRTSSSAGRSASRTKRTPRANASRGVPRSRASPRPPRRSRRRRSTCRRCSSCDARTCCSSTTTASSSSTSTRRTSACCTSGSWACSSGARPRRSGCSFPLTLHLAPARRRRVRGEPRRARAPRLRGRGVRRTYAARQRVPDAASALRRRTLPARDARRARGRSRRRRRTRGTNGSPPRSRARRRSRRVTSCRPPRCGRCSSRCGDDAAAGARRARSLDDRSAHVGRARAPLWPTVVRPRSRSSCGPTAAGKSALALRLAERTDVTIISADSRQLYRGFDIGTAKPTAAERERVPHCGIDVARPDAALRRPRGGRTAPRLDPRGARAAARAVVVGGTGLLSPRAVRCRSSRSRRSTRRVARRSGASCLAYPTDELRRWSRELDPARAHARSHAAAAGARDRAPHRAARERSPSRAARAPARWSARYLVVDPGPGARDADRAARRRDAGGRLAGRSAPADRRRSRRTRRRGTPRATTRFVRS